MEIQLEMSPQYCLFGFDYYWKDEQYDYNEVNLYFFIFKISVLWE